MAQSQQARNTSNQFRHSSMINIRWDWDGVIHHDMFEDSKSVNAEFYIYSCDFFTADDVYRISRHNIFFSSPQLSIDDVNFRFPSLTRAASFPSCQGAVLPHHFWQLIVGHALHVAIPFHLPQKSFFTILISFITLNSKSYVRMLSTMSNS